MSATTSHTMPLMQPLRPETSLRFACRPGVICFNECCRELDLALFPYDVLRLRRALGISSGEFMKKYVLVTQEDGQVFPICRLSMVDDGRASCVFVRREGCSVYADRPAACRAYPVGRGASFRGDGSLSERLVLLQERHCHGFAENCERSVAAYLEAQGLSEYNRFNDALLRLHQHPRVLDGSFVPTERQLHRYVLALYDLDRFRRFPGRAAIQMATRQEALPDRDEELLLLAIDWLVRDFFGP